MLCKPEFLVEATINTAIIERFVAVLNSLRGMPRVPKGKRAWSAAQLWLLCREALRDRGHHLGRDIVRPLSDHHLLSTAKRLFPLFADEPDFTEAMLRNRLLIIGKYMWPFIHPDKRSTSSAGTRKKRKDAGKKRHEEDGDDSGVRTRRVALPDVPEVAFLDYEPSGP